MQCFRPFELRHEGNVLTVPCGRCAGCRNARSREWAMRMTHELEFWQKACFVTLTYDDEHLPADGGLSKDRLRYWIRMLRRRLGGRALKYYCCGEYGETTFRPHYHAILFGVDVSDFLFVGRRPDGSDRYRCQCWSEGDLFIGVVTFESCRYVSAYVAKDLLFGKIAKDFYGDLEMPFRIQSLGIGKRWMEKYADRLRRDGSIIVGPGSPGSGDVVARVNLPRYYLNKLGLNKEVSWLKDRHAFLKRAIEVHETGQSVSDESLQRARNVEAKARLYNKGPV